MLEIEEDIKKMTALLNKQACQTNFEYEFEDFIDFEQLNDEEESVDYEAAQFEETNLAKTINIEYNKYPTEATVLSLRNLEQQIINSCCNDNFKQLMILNRTKNIQLVQIYSKIRKMLMECRKNITLIEKSVKNREDFNKSSLIPWSWKLAAPYFKDKEFFTAPQNTDTLTKKYNEELSIYEMFPAQKWSISKCTNLINAVQKNYLKNINEELNDDSWPDLFSDEHINWDEIAADQFQDKYKSETCKSFWHIYLHPKINKKPWTKEENAILKYLVDKYKLQNWEKIARELNTNRTALSTCLYYFKNINNKFKKRKFTKIEDTQLLELVKSYRIGKYVPWQKIVRHFNDRTRHQLYHHYTYFLNETECKRGKFSDAEDVLLMVLIDRFGKNFKLCSEYMPNRTQMQLKSRYNSNLSSEKKTGAFTFEDDQMIVEHVKQFGNKNWARLRGDLKRSTNQIRQRYQCIQNYLSDREDGDIRNVPKRNLTLVKKLTLLRFMADQYKHVECIPSLEIIEECLQNRSMSEQFQSIKNIDEMLIDCFKHKHSSIDSRTNLKQTLENVESLFGLLNVDLKLPENYQNEPRLDDLDGTILQMISCKTISNRKRKLVLPLLPPNVTMLQTMNDLFTKDLSSRSRFFSFDVDVSMDEKCDDIKLFRRRFNQLFKWSVYLMLENPNDYLSLLLAGDGFGQVIPVESRTSPQQDDPPSKRMKLSKLTRVENAVVEFKSDIECDIKKLELLLKTENYINLSNEIPTSSRQTHV